MKPAMFQTTPYRHVPVLSGLYHRLRRPVRIWRHRGDQVFCPVCSRSFSGWLGGTIDGACPNCESWTRQKLMVLDLEQRLGTMATQRTSPLRTLLFAPDPGVEAWLRARPELRLTTTDIAAPGVDLNLDITALDLADASYDLILCSHVMEHVPDDATAFAELYRVLSPGGCLLVQVPYARERAETYEDFSITDPAEREREFGQFDHVRVYGQDLKDRIAAAGFDVTLDWPVRAMSPEEATRYGLFDDAVFICLKPETAT
jgi:SAM-dependent methyltransferase